MFLLICTLLPCVFACRDPVTPTNSKAFYNAPHPPYTTSGSYREGTVVTYACNKPYELLGPRNRVCQPDGGWSPRGLPFCVVDAALNKPAFQRSVEASGRPYYAVDGNATTCSKTRHENLPWWYVDLKGVFPVSIIRVDLGDAKANASIVATLRVGNDSRPAGNIVCNVYSGEVKGQPVYLPCASVVYGRYVSIQLATFSALSLCDVSVYSGGDITTVSTNATWTAILGVSGSIGLGVGSAFLVFVVLSCCAWRKDYFASCCKRDRMQLMDRHAWERSYGLNPVVAGFGSRYELAWEELSIQTSRPGKQSAAGSLVRSPSTVTIWPVEVPLTVSKV